MSDPLSLPTRPGCLLCLLQASPSMLGRCLGGAGAARHQAARRCVDWALSRLIRGGQRGDDRFAGLAVVLAAYHATPEGRPAFVPLLRGLGDSLLPVPLVDLPRHSLGLRDEGLYRLVDGRLYQRLCQTAAEPPPWAEALEFAAGLLHDWLSGHDAPWPPVVLHFTEGAESDSRLARAAASLRLFRTPLGPAGLAHLGVNDLETVPWKPIEQLFQATAEGRAAPVACRVRTLRHVKAGNADEDWEDAAAADEAGGVVAVADGASEGIFAGPWARLLAEAFVRDRPDAGDAEVFAAWLAARRAEWAGAVAPLAVRWSQRQKLEQTGAAATLLTFRLGGDPPRWSAAAVGDSCLFWVRDGRLRASFPIAGSAHFPLGPALLRTLPGAVGPAPVLAGGECVPGDQFFLTTDAVAQHLLRGAEQEAVDWAGLAEVDEAAWRDEVDGHRAAGRMMNDDCTLVVVTVSREGSSA